MEQLIETIVGFLFIGGFFYLIYKAIKKVVSGRYKEEIKELYKEKVNEEDMRLAKDYLKGLKKEHFDDVIKEDKEQWEESKQEIKDNFKEIIKTLKGEKTEKTKPKNIKRRRK